LDARNHARASDLPPALDDFEPSAELFLHWDCTAAAGLNTIWQSADLIHWTALAVVAASPTNVFPLTDQQRAMFFRVSASLPTAVTNLIMDP
jgi:hypothetical protein